MRDFRKLHIWRQAHEICLLIYKETQLFPIEEKYGITSQLRRAAVSVPNNIAEGCGTIGEKEFARYLKIAYSSASEVDYLLLLCSDLGFLPKEKHELLFSNLTSLKKQIFSFITKLNAERI
ncbi:four helix bundle protein [Flectobacillus roseus]|uniref:Four helix bundle protein n=1 Tax=Flectobacillus roseus TaxID=502259 RepID=A0ABT6Y8C6_9BACT|nr:four helix bundle protein [Flectobacillus roseus]MDI9859810.1 four helix bundle protein [Flectobacillus roseus]MDI9869966.1 four helix bundle protein [Flectobacillus roseus]